MRRVRWRRLASRLVATAALAAGLGVAAALALGARPTTGDSPAMVAPAPAPAPAGPRTTVYFLTDDAGAPIGVRRLLRRGSPHARYALRALLAGPTAAELARGITTAVPASARVVSLRIVGRNRDRALVDLAGLPPITRRPAAGPTVLTRVRAITQVARTLIGTSGIREVRLRADGRRWGLPRMAGGTAEAVADYRRLLGWARVCAGQRSAAERRAQLSRCFSALP